MVGFPRRRRSGPSGPPTVGGPAPSPTPPTRASAAPRAPRAQRADATLGELLHAGPRVAAVFGPKAGCTFLTRILAECSEMHIRVLTVEPEDTIDDIIERVDEAIERQPHPELVIIDGAPRTAEETQAFIDARVIDPATSGVFVRLWVPDIIRVERGAAKVDLDTWHHESLGIDGLLFAHMPSNYYMIPNQPETGKGEAETALRQLALRLGIRR